MSGASSKEADRGQVITGTINLDVRDSVSDWDASLPDRAPAGAPNVLVVLFADIGCAAWSP